MKKFPLLLIFFGLLVGCEEKTTELEAGQEWAHITGTVKYAENLEPIYDAFVRTLSHVETANTDSSGAYDLAIALPKDAQEGVTVEIYKEGYLGVNLPAIIRAGENTPLPVVTLERYLDSTITDTTYTGSGPGEVIVLISMAPETLSVTGIGGQTSSQIVCEVRDATGKPVDTLHTAQINFELVEDPGGGAYLYPTTDVTDDSGRVATTFYAGTDAGIAVIQAQFATGALFIILPEIVIYQTGDPASIMLLSLEYDSIAVQGTGANEAATATFVIRDMGGSPISGQQPVTVNFEILGQTGGGEYLYPESDVTDALGQVSTTLNSGTVAGTVQLWAYLADADTIACTPVPIAIHSGLPDSAHFAVFPKYVNFPGYNYFGLVDSISAMVGDKYANPVPLGTSVYFSSSAGIIEGSATTDTSGFATVQLFSGPPAPPAIYPFGTVSAQTVGEGGAILSDSALVLFSGITQIYDVNPTTFNIPDAGSQSFSFRLSDQNGWPLAHDTHIKIEATAGNVVGHVDVTFSDTWDQSWTYFNFYLVDSDPGDFDDPVLAAIFIQVTSPNGDVTAVIEGEIN